MSHRSSDPKILGIQGLWVHSNGSNDWNFTPPLRGKARLFLDTATWGRKEFWGVSMEWEPFFHGMFWGSLIWRTAFPFVQFGHHPRPLAVYFSVMIHDRHLTKTCWRMLAMWARAFHLIFKRSKNQTICHSFHSFIVSCLELERKNFFPLPVAKWRLRKNYSSKDPLLLYLLRWWRWRSRWRWRRWWWWWWRWWWRSRRRRRRRRRRRWWWWCCFIFLTCSDFFCLFLGSTWRLLKGPLFFEYVFFQGLFEPLKHKLGHLIYVAWKLELPVAVTTCKDFSSFSKESRNKAVICACCAWVFV